MLLQCFSLIVLLSSANARDEMKQDDHQQALEKDKSKPIQNDPKKECEKKLFAANVTFVSDYINRGQTQTFGGPAVQGEISVNTDTENGIYAGLWGSNVSHDIYTNGSAIELNFFGGYSYQFFEDFSAKLDQV